MIQRLIDSEDGLWYENDMPEGCPPMDTFSVQGDFYRLVSDPPTEADLSLIPDCILIAILQIWNVKRGLYPYISQ